MFQATFAIRASSPNVFPLSGEPFTANFPSCHSRSASLASSRCAAIFLAFSFTRCAATLTALPHTAVVRLPYVPHPCGVASVAGDTEATPQGWGTYGSRTTAVCGSAVKVAAQRVKEKAKKIAAHLLEASEADLEWQDGKFAVKGSPDKGKTFGELALMANVAWNMPPGVEPGLEATAFFDPSNFVYPFGTHICTVEVDAETGETKILRYIAVDDCGPQINPMIVEGQVHGGVIQGLGEALQERAVYDEDGQLLTGTMMDYAVPKASQMPTVETAHTVTPSPVNPLGVKGVGETGTIASVPTLVNAVCDALAPLGVTHIDKPLTPARVWAAIRQAKGGGAR